MADYPNFAGEAQFKDTASVPTPPANNLAVYSDGGVLKTKNSSGTVTTLGASVDLASPSAIGSTAPNTGAFTTLSASTSLLVGTSGFIFGGTNLLENRNGTSAQTLRIYNTFTDASNYERGFLRWASNVFEIGAEAAGTGTSRNIRFYGSVGIGVSPSYAFHVGTSANTAAFGLYASNNSGFGVADMAGGFYGANIVSGSTSNPYYALNIVTGATVSTSQWSGGTSRFKVNSNGNIDFNGLLVLAGGVNFSLSTATGTKIGTATNQLLGFYNATPVDQPATVTDPTGGLTVDAEARTAINAIIDRLQELGLIA